jgi:hypothetical protein
MAYVRHRTTKTGAVSTVLVESYRDENGKPRQRILANLHGEPDVLSAHAKLLALWGCLHDQYKELCAEYDKEGKESVFREIKKIERKLDINYKEGEVIEKHCTATPEQIDAAIKAFQSKLRDAAMTCLGVEIVLGKDRKKAKAQLRRITT